MIASVSVPIAALMMLLLARQAAAGDGPGSASPPGSSDQLWLIIAASDPAPAAIAQKAKALAGSLPHRLVVQTRDCGDKKNVFALAAEIAASADAARSLLPSIRSKVKDAYVKKCAVVPRSLLSVRYPAVDATIADVPDDAVNWEDDDRISTAAPIADGPLLVVARYFVNAPEDPLEGRRERVVLAGGAPEARKTLENDCPSAGAFAARQGRIAFECAREQAGDHLLHGLLVFGADGSKLVELPHCRTPRFTAADVVTCKEEVVGADGRLKLRAKRTTLAALKDPGATKTQ